MNKFLVLFIVLLIGSGCGASKRVAQEEKTVSQEEETVYLKKVSDSEEKIKSLEERVDTLERELIDIRMDYISRINNLEVDIADQDEDIDRAIKEVERYIAKKIERAKRAKRLREAAKKAKARKPIISSEKLLEINYSKAIELYTAGNYQKSYELLNNMIIGKVKKNLQDNIYYWRGMNKFQMNAYEEGIKNFNVVIENYPKENKYFDAKLMVAVSHGMMGEKSLAINELTRLLDENIPDEIREKAKKAILQFQK